nr:MAG TPA: hypothetical protein [Caudoviricetes sp.]
MDEIELPRKKVALTRVFYLSMFLFFLLDLVLIC